MRYLLSTFLVFCFCAANAQLTDSTSTDLNVPFSLKTADKYWKFSPLDIFSAVPTFGTDVEVKVNNTIGLQAGLGLIPTFFQFMANEDLGGYDRMGGYKARVEGRLYMPVKTNRYIGIGFSVRHLMIRDDDVAIGMEPFTDQFGRTDFAYFQETRMRFNRVNTNLDIKYGFQKIKPGGLVLDFYAGFSIRTVQVRSNSELPIGGNFTDNGGVWTLSNNHNLTYPTPIVGFKIGFAQKGK